MKTNTLDGLREALSISDGTGDRLVHGTGVPNLTRVDPHTPLWLYSDGNQRPRGPASVYAFHPYENQGLGLVAAVFRGIVQAGRDQLTPAERATGVLASSFRFNLSGGVLDCKINRVGMNRLREMDVDGTLVGMGAKGFEPVLDLPFDPPGLTAKRASPHSANVTSGPVAVNLRTLEALGGIITIEEMPLPDLIATMAPPPN